MTQKSEFVAKITCKFQMVWHLALLCSPTVLTDTEGMDLERTLFIAQYNSKNRNKCNLVLNSVGFFYQNFTQLIICSMLFLKSSLDMY